MKELFISDLDGTLLDSNAKLSKNTTAILNELTADGLNFTAATARAKETTLDILKDLNFKLPLILMNGVLIYDAASDKFINVEYLSPSTSKKISEVFTKHNAAGLMYKLVGGETITNYESLDLPHMQAFFDERTKSGSRKFTKSDSFYEDIDESVIYFVLIDKREPLLRIKEDIEKIPGVAITMYRDIYTEDLYFFEVFSSSASKANAAQHLKKHLGADKLIAFGDNYNDVSMFETCDECYAVANAKSQLKELATSTIASCTDDGVAKFLQNRFA